MTPFETYQTYLSLKYHFSRPNYDCFKYNFKVKASYENFEKRRDRYQFQKLSKHKDPIGYLVSNFIKNQDLWIGDLDESIYVEWDKRKQSISYIFKEDLENLNEDFNTNFSVIDGKYPLLLKTFKSGKVCLETVIILDSILNFLSYWNKSISDDIVWPNTYLLLVKYRPFVEFNQEKCKKILQDHYRSYK